MEQLKSRLGYNAGSYFERTQRNHFFIGGIEGQKRIKELKIGVAGLGGMGSNIAEALIRLGVGHIRIADPDTIDLSNINRQVIANKNTVGKSKATCSEEDLRNLADDFEIITYDQGIEEKMVEEFVDGCDIIIDEIDVFPIDAHVILHREARKRNIPVYSAYVVGVGIHFYKFQGNDYTFEDFISIPEVISLEDKFDKIVDAMGSPLPNYLQGDNLLEFKKMALNEGIPIFGPATLLGHSVVSARAILDFLGTELRGVKIKETPLMPYFTKIDLATMETTFHKVDK